ncbi:kelch-like protein 28 [Amphiura filiformis]|uniref:kelch-like protein 28 n=1 Tax=Amphiura filiformis TaxID=82378 RepID=UPI003B218F64
MASDFGYFDKLGKSFQDIQQNKELCDIVLSVGGKEFHGHKVILAAASAYFRAMFTSGFKESNQAKVELDANAAIFEILFHYVYTGRLDVTKETIVEVLEMACYLQFTQVCDCCTDLIADCIRKSSATSDEDDWMSYGDDWKIWEVSVEDVLKYAVLADNQGLTKIADTTQMYLVNNYKQMKDLDSFLDIATADFLEKFLSHEELSTEKEEQQVLEMVVCWLKHDWKNRSLLAHRLLQKVRLGLVSVRGIRKLFDAEITRIPECKLLMNTVLRLKGSKDKAALIHKHPEFFAARSTITAPICGYVRSCLAGNEGRFKYYCDNDKQWHMLRIACLPYTLCYHAIVVVDGTLYVAGGEKEEECNLDDEGDIVYKHLFSYDPAKNKWNQLKPMNTPRRGFSIVHLDGFLYVIGGGNNECYNGLRDVERYDIGKKQWQPVASIPVSVRYVSSVLAYKGKLLACCEGDGSSILMYNPATNAWQVALEEPKADRSFARPPSLFIHKDLCYRVTYKLSGVSVVDFLLSDVFPSVPVVNKLEVNIQNDKANIVVGEEVKQDHIPPTRVGAFRMEDQVFINLYGFVRDTGVRISPDQSSDVNLSRFASFVTEEEDSNMVYFTFNPKKLKPM